MDSDHDISHLANGFRPRFCFFFKKVWIRSLEIAKAEQKKKTNCAFNTVIDFDEDYILLESDIHFESW